MKKIFYTVFLLIAATIATIQASAQVRYQPVAYRQVRYESFFYYPQSNVYYSFRTHQYIYPSRGGWLIAGRLPYYIHIGKEARVKIEHNGFDVWNDNQRHQYTFGRRYHNEPLVVYTPERRNDDYNRRDDDLDRRNNGY